MATVGLPCLVCEQDVQADVPNGGVLGGVLAFISGGYGSSVYDPLAMGDTEPYSRLHAVICDACLLAKGRSGILVKSWRPPDDRSPLRTRVWQPADEELAGESVTDATARSRAAEAGGEPAGVRPRRR